MKARRFKATILAGHKEDAVEVPFDPGSEWMVRPVSIRAGRRGYPVYATISEVQFKSFVVARSRRFFLLLPSEVLSRVGATVGDAVTLLVALEQAAPKGGGARVKAKAPSRKVSESRTRPRRGM